MISIVIPLYNEEESLVELRDLIDSTLSSKNYSYEIIFVDDGSTDQSLSVCKELAKSYPKNIKVFSFSRNYGKSAALSIGIKEARGDIIVTMDADLQDDPSVIPEMVEKLNEGWDLVSGWKKKRHDPIDKTLPSWFWNIMTSTLVGLRLHDFNCGFKIYRADTAKSLDIYGERHRYLPALAYWDGYRVTEMVVPHHPRKFGHSKFGAGRMVNGFLDLLTLLFLKKYLRQPLHFFGVVGILLTFLGTGILGYFGIQWVIVREMHIRPLMLLSVGSIIMGIQFISIGLIGEMITNANPKNNYKLKYTSSDNS